MKLDKTLNFKKVRCVKGYDDCLEIGKEYNVIDISVDIKVKDDRGEFLYWESDHFEPVLDSAENPLQKMELTPEFETEASEPKFKVGDPVYLPNQAGGKILKIQDNKACHYPFFVDVVNSVNNSLYEIDRNGKTKYGNFTDVAIKATPENHALLSKLYPHIKFEQPPASLTSDELVRAMLTKGIKNVLCLWGSGDKIIIDRLDYKGSLMSTNCHIVGGLTPIDWYTGEPLTEAVLDE